VNTMSVRLHRISPGVYRTHDGAIEVRDCYCPTGRSGCTGIARGGTYRWRCFDRATGSALEPHGATLREVRAEVFIRYGSSPLRALEAEERARAEQSARGIGG
jgi:hypothetical protein